MDLLGKTVRAYLKQARARQVQTAQAVALDLVKEGMTREQVEEMLYASEFEKDIVDEVLETLPGGSPKE